MKKYISVIAFLLSLFLLSSSLLSCGEHTVDNIESTVEESSSSESDESTAEESNSSESNESTAEESNSSESDESTAEESNSSESDESTAEESNSSESDESYSSDESNSSDGGSSGGETETLEPDREHPKEDLLITGKNAELISRANALAGGVGIKYSNPERTEITVTNKISSFGYLIKNGESGMLLSHLSDSDGNKYIENTMDVFVKMKDGSEYFASDSTTEPILNIYRYGYYYYENRIEGQIFSGEMTTTNIYEIKHTRLRQKHGIDLISDDGGILAFKTSTPVDDPWISFRNVSFDAENHDYIEITLRAEDVTGNADVYIMAGGHTAFSSEQKKSFTIIDDSEFHTYRIPLSDLTDYSGKVTGIRFDINTSAGALVEISSVRALKADFGGAPEALSIQRSFLTYSDKLHHLVQFSAANTVSGIEQVGMITTLDASRVSSIIVGDGKGNHNFLDEVDWASAKYVGFDVKNVGVFGYIMPCDDKSGELFVTLEDGVYKIIQTVNVNGGSISPSESGTGNANDLIFGQRIYTDDRHSFEDFILAAECERNPLQNRNFKVEYSESDNAEYLGYDALRGYYAFSLSGTDFSQAYNKFPNKQYRVSFAVRGDDFDRQIYIMTRTPSGNLESAALLDNEDLLLPVPLEVAKNFCGDGENTIFNLDDTAYGETYFPLVVNARELSRYTVVNLYQNWGRFPLKQISSIQFVTPYYHLSTGVTETNCIVPLTVSGPGLPDHRAMSAPFWPTQPQHNSGGTHSFLSYTDAEGRFSASNNTYASIGSYGPTYCDLTLGYEGYDGKIKSEYTHLEMPQTDENRAYYTMTYTVLEDISFNDFARDFSFYKVTDNDPEGTYKKVGYLDKNNESRVVEAVGSEGDGKKYVLGDLCPYFTFFDMPDYDRENKSSHGYTNLSFLIYDYEVTVGGERIDANFAVINTPGYLSLSLDIGNVELKAGDSVKINAIIMPWGSQESDYSGEEPDANVRRVRENTLLFPLLATANVDCEVMESVFLPKLRTTNGKSADFTLTGGYNNVAVRIYGFEKLTLPIVEEYVDGEWVKYELSSQSTPDQYGNGYPYDGYAVYYDGDGSYSYSFVTEMKGESRRFRISATEDFKGFPEPEIPAKDPDPINVYLDADEIYQSSLGLSTVSRSELMEDGAYVRYYGKTDTPEAFIMPYNLSENIGLKSTGQYVVVKYRFPEGIDNPDNFELFTSTQNLGPGTPDRFIINNIAPDAEWQVLIIDASTMTDSFLPSSDGSYLANYLRLDFFNGYVKEELYIDIAYMGMSDDLGKLLTLCGDMTYVRLVYGSESKLIDPKTGNTYEDPSLIYVKEGSGYVESSVPYVSIFDMLNGMGGDAPKFTQYGSNSKKGVDVIKHNRTTIAGSKLVFSGWAMAEGGIEKYVWSADGGLTWHDVEFYNASYFTEAGADHFKVMESVIGHTVIDEEATKVNVGFQGSPGSGENVRGIAADLSAYAGQVVNVTLAAVPKAEPDSLCVIIHVKGVTVLAE